MLKRFFFNKWNSTSKLAKETDAPLIADDQSLNPFNEICILTGHEDIINIIKVIDETRLASSADDNLVIIWDFENGDLLHRLHGHTRPVTSMLVHQRKELNSLESSSVLYTASSDKSIRIWDSNDGICMNVIDGLSSAVKCLVSLNREEFTFSLAEEICAWNIKGKLLCEEKLLQYDSDIHGILPIKNNKLVLAFNHPSLVVYTLTEVLRTKSLKFHSLLRPHENDVRCLRGISDDSFVSGSLDGEIIVWSSLSLQPMKRVNNQREFNYLQNYDMVQHLFVLDLRFVFAAIGSGFFVYDALSGKCVAQRLMCHHSKISYIELLKPRHMLVTCSEDGTVRLWGSQEKRFPSDEFSSIEHFLGKSLSEITSVITEPQLLGECLGHSGAVRMLADFGVDGFASCASDGNIILWKDGWRERERRFELATSLLFS
ncbi:LOW QUALITY PROTEIN: WD repeat-containing protein 41-like [Xenia sp. Carnegie-2017]|uniref:LOW QUALITY PROTEIN: WD repeat-containing protein 41-like n=1 Tax=Xenia sp. Carnegie-2017 TaxID=2897299 RepID=UPI001F0421A7|nr:LOW QUALITY PROTEIN: WD repeat-containing protein 41-like [Xenia sp. Carnegie-2017]